MALAGSGELAVSSERRSGGAGAASLRNRGLRLKRQSKLPVLCFGFGREDHGGNGDFAILFGKEGAAGGLRRIADSQIHIYCV